MIRSLDKERHEMRVFVNNGISMMDVLWPIMSAIVQITSTVGLDQAHLAISSSLGPTGSEEAAKLH